MSRATVSASRNCYGEPLIAAALEITPSSVLKRVEKEAQSMTT